MERIGLNHINDAHPQILAGQQTDPDRVMIGKGVIDLKAELLVLQEKGYAGAVSLKFFKQELWGQDPREVLKLSFERLSELVAAI